MGVVSAAPLHRRLSVLLGLALATCVFMLALASNAQAGKLCCGIFPPEPPSSEGTMGEQFGGMVAPGNKVITGISGIAVNVAGNGPGTTPGDIYVVDRRNNRIQQLHAIADGEGHRFVRAFGLDVGGVGVNVCTVAASCQAGTASDTAGGMSEPVGVAVDQATGNLYVSDNVNHRIDVFRADGIFEGAFGWKVNASAPLEELQFCTIATGCQAGSVGGGAGQFGERGNAQELNEIGEQRSIGHPAVAPTGAPDAGNVIVADSANNRVDEFGVTLNGSKEVTGASFVRGIGWNVNSTAAEEKLQTCTTASGCQAGSPGGGLGQFTKWGLTRVAVDSTGAIYAVNNPDEDFRCDTTTSHCHVQKINPAATSAAEFAPGQLNRTKAQNLRVAASEIAVDPVSGDVYVARPNNIGLPTEYQILRFDSVGNVVDTFRPGTAGIGVNERTAFGLALNHADGNLYVTSTTGGQRIYLLTNPPPIPPTVTTGGTSAGPNFSLMNLAGAVNPEGFRILGCRFEYGTSTEYGTTTPCLPSAIGEGTGPVAVGAETEPLEPLTTYHYRLVAENGGPLGLGEDRTFTSGPAPPDSCPNAARRAEQGIAALVLPDCMALEMVSPPKKDGKKATTPEVSVDGSRVAFISQAAIGDTPSLPGFAGNTFVAGRDASGWESESTVPAREIFKLWNSENDPSFTPDFSRWFELGATQAQEQLAIGQIFEGGLGGLSAPFSQLLVPLNPVEPTAVINSTLQGASTDHSHLYFQTGLGISYFPGDPDLGNTGTNVYLARRDPDGQLALELLSRDRTGKVWGGNCASRLGGIGVGNGERNQGAISPDGSRTYLSARVKQPATGNCSEANKLRILERLETDSGPVIGQVFSSECSRVSPPCKTEAQANGNDLYQGASADGQKLYFTTNRQLADTDLDGSNKECSTEEAILGCDLYLYDRSLPSGERLIQVSAGGSGDPTPGEGAKVYNGITAISGDGSHVYFVAQGVLSTDTNPEGASAQAGEPNLYLWDAGSRSTTFLGTLSAKDGLGSLWGGGATWRSNAYPVPVLGKDSEGTEVGGDGHVLLFRSKAGLSPEDTDGEHADIYRYDVGPGTPSLECLSCRPGGPDSAPLDVGPRVSGDPAGTDFAEDARWVSEDGETVGFLTPEALVPGDVNGADDFYLWRHGGLVRIPGKPFASGAEGGPFLSHDGSVIAFATSSPLLPQDGDTVSDVYVAQIGGGYPHPVPEPCLPGEGPGRRCQQVQSPPAAPSAASGSFAGPGNPKPGPKQCPKGKLRRKGRCVARHAHKRHAKRAQRNRHANADRRAAR